MRSRKLLALLFCLITFPAIAGYMTLLGAGVGNISPTVSWVAGTDTFPDTSLTYSGPSLSTMFDSTGKLTYKPNNLLTYSNTFSNAAWTKVNATITSGVTDPLGGTNAFTVTATSASAQVYQGVSFTGAGSVNFIQAVWVKRRTGSGTVAIYTPNGLTQTPIAVSGSWQLFYISGAGNGANIAYNTIWITTSGDAIDVYAATLSAVTYETSPRASDQVITTSAAYYGPRIDYDPNTLAVKGLLIEEARTWVALWNRDFTNAAWTKTSVTAAKDQTGIDGVANAASSLTATGANGTVLQSITLASSQRATSAYVKRLVGSGAVSMTTDGGTTWTDITSQLGAGSYARATIPAQTVTNPSVGFKFATSGDSIAVDYFGNENGAFATSALYLTTASVTRAADVVQFTGPALTALQGSAWSAIVETGALAGITAGSTGILGLNASQSAMYVGSATQLASFNGASGRTATIGSSGNFTTGSVRSAIATDASGRTIVANGGTVSTDGNKAAPTAVTSANLGALNGGTFPINGPVKSFAIYNQRLPDATLQAKSVVGASYAANDNGIRYAFADNDNLPIHWRVAL